LVERVSVLLKTRYTSDQYWRAGQQLFRTCQGLCQGADREAKLQAYLDSCTAALGDEEDREAQAAAAPPHRRGDFLFEGQLSSAEEQVAQRRPADVLESMLVQAMMGRAPGVVVDPAAMEAGMGEEDDQGLQDLIQEVLAVSAEEAGDQPLGPPPASKKVVASLPVKVVTAEELEALGGKEVECTVCRENINVGDKLQKLPCRHVFHPPCLAPWLSQHNSCPVCRHELPTDDWRYETRKERAQEEAETERGRDNALSHSEFLYI